MVIKIWQLLQRISSEYKEGSEFLLRTRKMNFFKYKKYLYQFSNLLAEYNIFMLENITLGKDFNLFYKKF